jgi:hypothetical protein
MDKDFKYLVYTTGEREIKKNSFSPVTDKSGYKIKTMLELNSWHLHHHNSYAEFIHMRVILQEHEETWCFELSESITSIYILI